MKPNKNMSKNALLLPILSKYLFYCRNYFKVSYRHFFWNILAQFGIQMGSPEENILKFGIVPDIDTKSLPEIVYIIRNQKQQQKIAFVTHQGKILQL